MSSLPRMGCLIPSTTSPWVRTSSGPMRCPHEAELLDFVSQRKGMMHAELPKPA